MEHTYLEYLKRILSETYYTPVLWICCLFLSLVIGLNSKCEKKIKYPLIAYILANIFLPFLSLYVYRFVFHISKQHTVFFIEVFNTLFAIIELGVFCYIFKNEFRAAPLRRLSIVFFTFFLITAISLLFLIITKNASANSIRNYSLASDCIEFFSLLILCLLFFYQLLTEDIQKKNALVSTPSFWIISGIFFYSVVSLPLVFIAYRLFLANRELYLITGALHYISICFLLICISKAFTCRTNPTI
jgi:hypothetical protein